MDLRLLRSNMKLKAVHSQEETLHSQCHKCWWWMPYLFLTSWTSTCRNDHGCVW